MRSVLMLLMVLHSACAVRHSLQYFYTGVSGIDFPEFTAVGLVDGGQFMYFDSNIKTAVPKTEWIRQNEGEDYWNRETQIHIGHQQAFKNNIQIAKERFNQSSGVHTVQNMYGCEWDDETDAVDGFEQYGYDGEDFVSLDFRGMRFISAVQQGFITVQKLNNDRVQLEYDKQYYTTVCIEWLKKYLQYGKMSLEKTVSPQVSLLQKDSSSPVICHATGFYPSGVKISWMKNGQEHDEDVDLGQILPNEDGSFQKMSSLTVPAEELKNNKFSCVVEHQGRSVTVDEIRVMNAGSTFPGLIAGVIAGVIAAVMLLVVTVAVIGYKVYQKKQKSVPDVMKSSTSSESSCANSTKHLKSSVSDIDADPGYSSCSDRNSDSVSDAGSDGSSESASDQSSAEFADSSECLIAKNK